jgi:hypothetical protein
MAGNGAGHPPISEATQPKPAGPAAPPAELLQRLGPDCLWVCWEFRGDTQGPEGPFGRAAGRLRRLLVGQEDDGQVGVPWSPAGRVEGGRPAGVGGRGSLN